jgi:hypothetical protein
MVATMEPLLACTTTSEPFGLGEKLVTQRLAPSYVRCVGGIPSATVCRIDHGVL